MQNCIRKWRAELTVLIALILMTLAVSVRADTVGLDPDKKISSNVILWTSSGAMVTKVAARYVACIVANGTKVKFIHNEGPDGFRVLILEGPHVGCEGG